MMLCRANGQDKGGDFVLFNPYPADSFPSQEIDTSDYLDYHRYIYQAEKFFLQGRDSLSMELYRKVFSAYPFIFAKDAAIATQIAAKNNTLPLFYYFAGKSFSGGGQLDCLLDIPMLSLFIGRNNIADTLSMMNGELRKTYLASIDLKKKQFYISNYRKEQSLKKAKNFEAYKEAVISNINCIRQDVTEGGFPADRIIGLDDAFLTPERDHCQLSSELALISLYHYPCSYSTFKDIWFEEVRKGNIHPKDIAYIYEYEGELAKNKHNRFEDRCTPLDKDGILVYIDWDSPTDPATFKRANEQRQVFFLPPIQHDLDKREYAQRNGMKLFFGFGIGFFKGHR
ncbi:MAG: hypothetical protein H6560_09430 [Lewinellaceae bacterium]|nr:hypothetical protein [Lewinellaceae bacterium]